MNPLFVLFFSLYLNATFLPESDEIYSNFHSLNQEVPQKYKDIESTLLEEFEEDIKSIGAKLEVRYDMHRPTVNAYAIREGSAWIIIFQGGLITHPKFNADVYATVLCHELGHHLAGAPFKAPQHPERYWTSAEGQADYFATNVCLKRLLVKENYENTKVQVSEMIQMACKKNYERAKDFHMCLRNAQIAEATGNFLYYLGHTRRGNRSRRPNISEPDTKLVRTTIVEHMGPQCRLDTFFQGALCNIENFYPFKIYMNCPDTSLPFAGSRPRCWYAPPN